MAVKLDGGRSFQADINVTPLVDVVLVLLIIFMVVTPLLQRSVAVELPEAEHVGAKEHHREQVTVVVAQDGALYYDDDRVDEDELRRRLRTRLAYNPGLELFVKADRRLDYGSVRRVMSLCRRLGARRVVLATKERKSAAAE